MLQYCAKVPAQMASAPEPDPVSPDSSERLLSEREPLSQPLAPKPRPGALGAFWFHLGGFVRTVRPHQWVKNVFVLAPIFFAIASIR
jgi:decaprenyl-phosphate phosphoribosyltransferase